MSGSPPRSQAPDYRSVLGDWDARSAVRSKPRRTAASDGAVGLHYSAALTPAAGHPLLADRGEAGVAELLTRRLYSYLDFTTILEQEIVNPVVLRLSRGDVGVPLPDAMRFDAYRIYCDEAYHALFSEDVRRQVEAATGIRAPRPGRPQFARAVGRLRRQVPSRLRDLVDLSAAMVSETLISATLTDIPADRSVVPFVRSMFADHAADERTHHAYFARVGQTVWPVLDPQVRALLGPGLADLILAFLSPDDAEHRRILREMRFSTGQARLIVASSHPEEVVLRQVRHEARSTIRLLRDIGALADGRTEEYFHQRGLLTG
ncbi:diiron oxygenase [Micromonospora sp. NPDC003197]